MQGSVKSKIMRRAGLGKKNLDSSFGHFPGGLVVRQTCSAGDASSTPGSGRSLEGTMATKSHGQRSLTGYSS